MGGHKQTSYYVFFKQMVSHPISSSLCGLSCFVDLFSKSARDGGTTSCDLGKMLNTFLYLACALVSFASINNAYP